MVGTDHEKVGKDYGRIICDCHDFVKYCVKGRYIPIGYSLRLCERTVKDCLTVGYILWFIVGCFIPT